VGVVAVDRVFFGHEQVSKLKNKQVLDNNINNVIIVTNLMFTLTTRIQDTMRSSILNNFIQKYFTSH